MILLESWPPEWEALPQYKDSVSIFSITLPVFVDLCYAFQFQFIWRPVKIMNPNCCKNRCQGRGWEWVLQFSLNLWLMSLSWTAGKDCSEYKGSFHFHKSRIFSLFHKCVWTCLHCSYMWTILELPEHMLKDSKWQTVPVQRLQAIGDMGFSFCPTHSSQIIYSMFLVPNCNMGNIISCLLEKIINPALPTKPPVWTQLW